MKMLLTKFFYYAVFFFLISSCGNHPDKGKLKEEYFDNGNLKVHAVLDNGVEHGLYKKFHKNGKLKEFGIKIKGKANGVWKYFDSDGHFIAVKQYYNDEFLFDLDLTDFDFKTKSINGDLEIMIPKKWELINIEDKSPVIFATRKNCNDTFCPNLTVTKELFIKKKSIKDYLYQNRGALHKKFDNFKLLKEREYKFENTIFFEKIYTGNYQGINIGGITTWVFEDDSTYIITGLALNEKENSFLKYEGLLKEMTFSFTKK